MNSFESQGFIDYNGSLRVHQELLVVSHPGLVAPQLVHRKLSPAWVSAEPICER